MTDTHEAVRLAELLCAAVQMWPQMSEDEPGGYCSEMDQMIDQAATLLRRIPELEAEVKQLAKQAASVRSHLTDALAFLLCEKDGNDNPHHLIWEGGAGPEPWGEVWQKYLPDAEALAEAAFKYANDWGLAFDKAEAQALNDAIAERDRLRAELEKVRAPDVVKVGAGFRWDGEAQHHIPTLLVEFEHVPVNGPCDSKGWRDRDALAALLAAPTPPNADQKGAV